MLWEDYSIAQSLMAVVVCKGNRLLAYCRHGCELSVRSSEYLKASPVLIWHPVSLYMITLLLFDDQR